MSNKITLLMLIIIIIADKYKTNFMFFSTSCHISFPSLMNCEEMNFFNAYCLAQKKRNFFYVVYEYMRELYWCGENRYFVLFS